ncbi:metallophosphoesterase [Candidatus Electronema sp. JM]|uniref:metallophosphoesterase n=1 Tax=Candidatus Electronema sp. JM TaxID=3401571 RepID=UPI003AA8873C
MIYFVVILVSLVTVLHLYAAARLAALWPNRRRILLAVFALLWLLFALGLGARMQDGPLWLEAAGMQWMGILFLLAVGLFAADLSSGFGLFLPKNAVRRLRMTGLACGIILAAVAHVQGLRPPAVERHELAVSGLPAQLDGLKIAVLSDIHLGQLLLGADWLKVRVQQVQELRPDCIVLVGDLFERGSQATELVPILRQFAAPLGVFAVRGNHDAVRPRHPDLAGPMLAAANIRLLTNEWTALADGLVLAGVDDLTAASRQAGEGEANLARALAKRPAGTATVLLSHTPWLTAQAAAAHVSLMISGHTHNGQIWPFGELSRLRYPLFNGTYQIDAMALFVSRGTGTWGPRMRLWQRGEITLLTLRSRGQQ